ncbi:SICA antigen [Plasmodium coatneyi]|uniref:SICA antigen n=1 Tax=Plasmodium coatneyi TaxID=208452 RepID=A0A1B1E121_9APIC|nr:SICA antigen [Plasmodium coatneyi]ANQ08732.1 SICA antigen [Plasmodium coatneyi]
MGYEYTSKMLVAWMKAKGAETQREFEAIWDDFKKIFQDAMKNVYSDHDVINELCRGDVDGENENWDNKDKELCKVMVKIFMYINGIKTWPYDTLKGIESKEGHEQMDSYFRCIIGRTIMIKWLGGHCRRKKVAKIVLGAAGAWRGMSKVEEHHRKCEGLDFKNMGIAGKYMWPRVKEWAKMRDRGISKLESVKKQGECSEGSDVGRLGSRTTAEDEKYLTELFGVGSEKELDELKKLAEDGNKWGKEDLEDVLKKAKEAEEGGEGEDFLVRKLQESLGELYERKKEEFERNKETEQVPVPQPDGRNENDEEEDEEEELDEGAEDEEDEEAQEEEDRKPPSSGPPPAPPGSGGGGGGASSLETPKPAKLTAKINNPFLPYIPLVPATIGITVMSYLLWKYFGMLRKTRKRYRRAHQVRGPNLDQQMVDHVDDQADGPQVLDECQKGDLHLTKEGFFEILVEEFMGSKFKKEQNLPKEVVPKEHVPSSDSGFREEDFVPEKNVPMEQVRSSDSGFRERRLGSSAICSYGTGSGFRFRV